ncbi:winged helix-turn-helix domain-containing protein [Methanofollis ethanolicus]|uniref:winged helix-turn-helix domain-containing protein n=1 Tax=Methanofollis ethanolicus TaxID=488124 RepID=UPI00082C76BD|nr:winged helix-turn-helix domain-containing protein [Methanofollis ethanolicus]
MLSHTIPLRRETLEVLSSEQRVQILKHLDKRRMTITELSEEMECAKSTVHHHVEKLIASGFVAAIDEGHRWVYLELTTQGHMILHPSERTRIVLLLTSIPFAFLGGMVLLGFYLTRPVLYTGDVHPLWNIPDPLFLVGGIGLLGAGTVLAAYAILQKKARVKPSPSVTLATD